MSNLIEIKKNVVRCPKGNISSDDVSIIKIKKSKGTRNEVAEEYEVDSFLKSMALQIKYEMGKTDKAEYDEQELELLKLLERIREDIKINKEWRIK
jgi:hypothetical protein